MSRTTPSTRSTRPATASSPQRHRNLPTDGRKVGSRKRQGKRIPILTLDAFIAAHNNERLINYAKEPPRRDSVRVGRDVIDELTDDGTYPYANNSPARITWARIAAEEARKLTRRSAPVRRFFFVTLTLAKFTVPYEDARALDLEEVQKSARRLFKGLNFLAVVEPALYTETAQLTA